MPTDKNKFAEFETEVSEKDKFSEFEAEVSTEPTEKKKSQPFYEQKPISEDIGGVSEIVSQSQSALPSVEPTGVSEPELFTTEKKTYSAKDKDRWGYITEPDGTKTDVSFEVFEKYQIGEPKAEPKLTWESGKEAISEIKQPFEITPEKTIKLTPEQKQERQARVDEKFDKMLPVDKQITIARNAAYNGTIDILKDLNAVVTGTAFGVGGREGKEKISDVFDSFKADLPTNTGEITIDNVTANFSSMLPFLLSFATGQGEISAATRLLGVGEKTAQVVGTVGASMALGYNQGYEAAKEKGLDDVMANEYAIGKTMLDGLVFSFLPALKQIKGWGTESAKVGAGVLAENIAKGTPTKQAVNNALKSGLKIIEDNAKNTGLMVGGLGLGEKMNQAVANLATGKQTFDLSVDPQEVLNHTLMTSLTFSPLSTVAGVRNFSANNKLQKEALIEAAKNPDYFKGLIEVQLNEGRITAEQKDMAVAKIDNAVNLLSKIPKDLPTDKKEKISPFVEMKQRLEAENKIREEEKKNLDTAFHERVDAIISENNKYIEDLAEQIKKEITPPTPEAETKTEGEIKQPKEDAKEEKKEGDEGVLTPEPTAVAEGVTEVAPEGESVSEPQKAVSEPQKEAKKTVVTKRAYEGEFREGVKKELEKIGLTRDVENQDEAISKAKEFVEKVGDETAFEALQNNDIEGGSAAAAWNILIENVSNKLATEKDPQKVIELEKLEAQLIEEWGKKSLSSGRFSSMHNKIYQTSDLGYNLQGKIKEYKEANNGEIPAEVEAKFRAIDKELKEVRIKLSEAEARAKKAEDERSILEIKASVDREKNKQTQIKEASKILAAKIRTGKLSRPDVFSSATPASLVWDTAIETVAKTIEAGGTIAQAVVDGLRTIKNSDWYKGLSDEKQKEAEKGYRGFVEKQQETAGRKIKIPTALIRDFVARGIDNIEDLTIAVKDAMKKEYPDATERDIRDAITEYGKTANLNTEEIATQIRKMKRLGRIISALEDIQDKKRPLRSGVQRDKLDAQERAKNKELREAMKDLPVDAELEAQQLKTATDAAKQRLKNQIEDLQREIESKEKVPRNVKMVKDDAEIIELKAKRDKLKEDHDKIFKDEDFKAKLRLEQTKKRTQTRIEFLQNKLKTGDFTKRPKQPLVSDSELIKLKADKLRLQEQYDKEIEKARLQNRTRREKWIDNIWDIWGITRLLQATGEFSFVGIQGLQQSVAHPIHAKEAFKIALQNFASESKSEKWLREIKSQEWYPELKQSKLAITEPNAKTTAREELFFSDYTNLVWDTIGFPIKLFSKKAFDKWTTLSPFKGFERAASGYLDTLRVLRFLDGKQMLEKNGITFNKNPEAYKQMADAINTMTGRASLGRAEQLSQSLTKVFFSPRNWASAIKTATPYALYHFGKMRAGAEGFKPSIAQKMAIGDFAKFIGATTSMVALAAAYFNNDDDDETGVEFDPTSSDFGKIKIGDTRIDPWGGRIQQVVLLSRFIADSVKKESGEIIPLGTRNKTPTKKELLIDMATNKLAPSASLLEKYLSTQTDSKGNKVTRYGDPYEFSEELKEKIYPIYWGTINELLKDDATALDGLLIFYAFFGGGVQTFEKREKKKKEPQKPKTPEEKAAQKLEFLKKRKEK